jgi:DnaK suppressor protein
MAGRGGAALPGKGIAMHDLDNDRIADLRKRLVQKREALLGLQETGAEAASTVELDQTTVGRLSRMDDLRAQAMSQESERRRHLELQRINSALQRMAAGEYGYCIRCGEEIALKRLEFDPATPLCIRCASEAESGER